jgi:small subunit ribosomal protein S35
MRVLTCALCFAYLALRKPFIPPTSKEPLIVRSTDYLGDSHPADNKKSVVVAVDDLQLKDEIAKKRLIMLAGPRWTPNPPADAGISKYADWGYGYVKIACEAYPLPAQNLKWISDTLDRLIERANVGVSLVVCFSVNVCLLVYCVSTLGP